MEAKAGTPPAGIKLNETLRFGVAVRRGEPKVSLHSKFGSCSLKLTVSCVNIIAPIIRIRIGCSEKYMFIVTDRRDSHLLTTKILSDASELTTNQIIIM